MTGFEPGRHGSAASRRDPTAREQAPRILVVENDPSTAVLVGTVLEDAGYHVEITMSLSDAIACLQSTVFDLVITEAFAVPGDDTARPACLGCTTLLESSGPTPALLYTTYPVAWDAVRAAGFQEVLAKPFDLDQLEEQVSRLLAQHDSSHAIDNLGAERIGERPDNETS